MNQLSVYRLLLITGLIFFNPLFSGAQGIHSLPFMPPTDPTIGKPCPDVELNSIINYPQSKASISDFRGKILIIDFYTTHCRGCILSFPKYDSLQREFGDKIQVLLCTHESQEAVRKLFNKYESLRDLHLASVVSDTVLANIFYHRTYPHVVLLDSKGIVRAVTNEVNQKDIEDLLVGDSINLPVKKDAWVTYNPEAPQLISDYQYYGQNHFYFYSYIAPLTIATAPAVGIEKDKQGNIRRIIVNGYIETLYKRAYGKNDNFNSSRIILDFKDSTSFKKVNLDKGINCYTYDLILNPAWQAEKAYKYMQSQLDAFFNVRSHEEIKKVKCWVIESSDSSKDKLRSKGEKAGAQMVGKILKFRNGGWWNVIRCINWDLAIPPYQIVDKTGIDPNEKVDININTDFTDFEAVKKSLMPYGLSLSVEYLPMTVIVLK